MFYVHLFYIPRNTAFSLDVHIQDIFQMTVDSIKDMDDLSSSLYTKRVSILDIHAKIRSCLLLLDFGCNELIIRMFNHFFKVLRLENN